MKPLSLFDIFRKDARYYTGPISDHFDGERFFNPGHGDNKPADFKRWRAERKPARWPATVKNAAHPVPPQRVDGASLRVTFLGHATFLIQTQGLNILTDPYLSDRASPFQFMGPKRVRKPGVAFRDLPKIDAVLVSHNHYDHMDLPALRKIRRRDKPQIITPLGNDYFIPGAKTFDWGQSISIAPGIDVHLEQAYHWSARGLHDRRKALWGAFVLTAPGGPLYFAGDTAYRDGKTFRDAHAKYGDFRAAMLPIGAYAPRWFMKNNHMGPDEAVQAFHDLGKPLSLAMHFQTLQLTDEGIDEPAAELAASLDSAGVARDRFIATEIGRGYDIP